MTNEFDLQADICCLQRNNEALIVACCDGAVDICEVLFSFGAEANSMFDEQTPLFSACLNAHPACVDMLLAHAADVNEGDLSHFNGGTPLMAAVRVIGDLSGRPFDQFIENRCQCMNSLLSSGATIDQTDSDGETALMAALWNFRLAKCLIDAGANLNNFNENQYTALHLVSIRNTSAELDNLVELLLERGVEIDALDVNGETALHFASCSLYLDTVNSLLRRCADVDIVNNNGETAFQLVLACSSTSMNRVAVLQLMTTCAQTRLKANLSDWIRLAQNECNVSHL